MINKNDITNVCIDDFALKKREKYGTVMIDINTHTIVDMLESRDQSEVVEWLKSYPNIKIVSRDGSITYHNSIAEAHPRAIQVSDRFHLYKNLTDYAIEYLKKKLKSVIEIIVDKTEFTDIAAPDIIKENQNRRLTLEEKYNRILLLQAEKRNQTEICHAINMDVRCYKRLMSASDEERIKMFNTIATTRHDEKISNKMKLVNEVRELKSKGLSNRAISRETRLSTATIVKYLDEKFNPVHAAYGIKKASKLSAYSNYIDDLLNQGIMASKIEESVRDMGYNGSSSTIRHYASEWKKRFKNRTNKDELEEGKVKITLKRNNIFKTLFKPTTEIKDFEEGKFQYFCKQYPFFNIILQLIRSFKDIFVKNKPELLQGWIDKARSTEVRELISFTNGIERDYDAVKNAASLPYSNGLAEGSVNKIKVIKRIMYGRCSFETLRVKTIRLEKMRKIN